MSTSLLLGDAAFSWETPDERRALVEVHHHRGSKVTEIAKKLNCSRKTIQRDLTFLGLETFSVIDDAALAAIVFN